MLKTFLFRYVASTIKRINFVPRKQKKTMIEYRPQYPKKKKNTIFIGFAVLILITILIVFAVFLIKYRAEKKLEKKEIGELTNYVSECDHVSFATAPIKPSSKLNDPNELQLIHAEKNGVKPFVNDSEFLSKIEILKSQQILVEVTENKFYRLKSLTHSQPYLIPEAVDLLNEIGYRFQKQLEKKKKDNYQFRITSLLRTVDSQSKLSHRNGNATAHSAHLYGTTFDISYKNFYNTRKDTLESVMPPIIAITNVLTEMRKECKLMVVRERHQSCFHITVVVCKPPCKI